MSDNYNGKKVFITGAGGFIGSHVVEALVEAGAEVKALVHYNSASSIGNLGYLDEDKLGSVNIEFGDITDPFQMLRLSEGQDVILHLAALIGIPYSYVAPAAYVRANIDGTLNMLEAARMHNTPRIVSTSTSETYGTAKYTPIDEDHPLQGQSPYSATKIGADKIAESYFRSFDLSVCTIRPFNTYGPRQSMRAVLPTIINQALHSDRIKLGSITPVRDMLFVKDTANAFLAAGLSDKAAGHVINAGTGTGQTIGEMVEVIQEILGTSLEIVTDEDRIRPEKSEVFELVCNHEKARELLGWEPTYSFSEGISETIEFFKLHSDKKQISEYHR